MIQTQQYSAVVEQHFARPQHIGPLSGSYEAVLSGRAGHREQGTEVMFNIGVTAGRIDAITFQAFGCPHTIAACSILTERLVGQSIEALEAVQSAELAASLDLPVEKTGRLLIIEDALRKCRAAWDNRRLGQK